MANNRSLSISRISGSLLVLGALACFIGVWMSVSGENDPGRSSLERMLEHGFIAAAVVVTAIGFVVLEDAFQDSARRALFKVGSAGYFFAGVLLVAGEGLSFTIDWDEAAVLIGVYVVSAYLAQACIGGALIQSGLTSRSVGWVTLLWNLGWFLALLIIGWEVGYIPILHHLMPLIIGIALVRRRE